MFFKKKKTVDYYLKKIERNRKLFFQMDIITLLDEVKQARVDVQIFRKSEAKNFDVEFQEIEGDMVLMSFSEEKHGNEENFQRFKNSKLFEKAHCREFLGDSYIILINNIEELKQVFRYVLNLVYLYNPKTVYTISFEKLT